jgi:hypothetical protein
MNDCTRLALVVLGPHILPSGGPDHSAEEIATRPPPGPDKQQPKAMRWSETRFSAGPVECIPGLPVQPMWLR